MWDDDLWFATTLNWAEWVLYVFHALKRSTGIDISWHDGDDLDNYYYVDLTCEYFQISINRNDLQYSRGDIKEDYGFDANACMRVERFTARYQEGREQLVNFLRLVTEERGEDFLWLVEDNIILKKQGGYFYTEVTEKYLTSVGEKKPYPFELLGPYYKNLIVKED